MDDYKKILEQTIREEDFYRFPVFTQDNVLDLAREMIASCDEARGPMAVEIDVAGQMVFRYYPKGTGRFNEQWLARKRNTVSMFGKSSLRVWAEMMIRGEELEKDMLLDPKEYAACGGGFPIILQNGSIAGFIGTSGLTDKEDHAVLIEGLEKYFRRYCKELY